MAMTQATRTASRASYQRRAVAWRNAPTAEMPLFQAFLCFSHQGTTDCRCIKDGTPIDPANGSGNFLTETYLSLRRLENEVIAALQRNQITMAVGPMHNPIKVQITQMHGIEINDFAVSVAKTALWIAESQMMKETEDIIKMELDFLPLTTNANIVEGNALRMDWNDVVSAYNLNYIMGNPPFLGAKLTTPEQREDRIIAFESKDYGKLDYVACWYKKAADYMENTDIEGAFVSTNSITQGEQVPLLWKPLFNRGIQIDFARRTFQWDSEAVNKAHVHVVVIGFSYKGGKKVIFDSESEEGVPASNINAYLCDAPNVFIDKTQKARFGQKPMVKGSQLIDGGHFVFSEDEKEAFCKKYPEAKPYFYRYINADTYLNNRPPQYCLYLKDCPPDIIKRCRGINDVVRKVYEYRINSKGASTRKLADRPTEYFISNIPQKNSLLFPVVSSERRRYVPIGFVTEVCVYTNAINYVDDATLYDFGICISNVHMAWMRTICGRLKSDYRYSKDIVYNNFPWPTPTDEQKAKIEQTAQGILDTRAKYPDSSLADLYDPLTMPQELLKAHQANDRAVMKAYGFNVKTMSESDCVAELMKMYQKLTAEENNK